MTRITNSDQVLNLIRAELQKMERSRKSKVRSAPVSGQDLSKSPLQRLFSAPAFHALSEEEQHRALIRGIMTEAFGPALANDARFIALAGTVYETIRESEDGRDMLRRALDRLNT